MSATVKKVKKYWSYSIFKEIFVEVLFNQREKVILTLWNSREREIIRDKTDIKANIFNIFIINGPGLKFCTLLEGDSLLETPMQLTLLREELAVLLVVKDLERKKILTSRTTTIIIFMEDTNSKGFITIEISTELNRRPLDLAGLGQTYKSRT